MKILFYLPTSYEFWFRNVLAPMIRVAARDAEVHVIVPPQWHDGSPAQCVTGLSEEQLASCADLADVRWHIVGGDDHPTLRTVPAAPDPLVDFVREIDPDYTFCRSADIATPGLFPGQVRFVMEGEFPPLPPRENPSAQGGRWVAPMRSYARVALKDAGILDHGIMPALDDGQRDWLMRRIGPAWRALAACRAELRGDRATYLAEAGLPANRRIIALPLDYDGPIALHRFTHIHNVEPSNIALIEKVVAQLGDDFILAVTPHPLQQRKPSETARHIATMDPTRIRLVEAPGPTGNATLSLIQHSDAVITTNSKVFPEGPYFGKPMLRASRFATGEWLNAYSDLSEFMADLRAGRARAAAPEDMMLWYAFHYANDAFAADDPALTLAELIDRVEQPVNPGRWEASLGGYLDEKYGPLMATFG